MRHPADPQQLLRATNIESVENRLFFSGQPVYDFFLDDTVMLEGQAPLDEVSLHLADIHDAYGVSHARNHYGLEGTGQTVVVIDSGIAYDHFALGGGIGDGHRVVGGWDFTEENDDDPYDDGPAGFHGTHVSGIIGSSDAVYTGVAPGVDLIGLRVFNDLGMGMFGWVENALSWVHEHRNEYANPITTVNMSLGAVWNSDSLPSFAVLEDELAQLHEDGIFVAVAAGNSFQDYLTPGLSYPAVSPHVVPVASVTHTGVFSGFSQRQEQVLAAPGQSITSTVPDYLFSFDGVTDNFATASGTSMAAPYVAGASVLVREAMQFAGLDAITQDTVYDHLFETSDVFYDSVTRANYRRLNLESALDAIMPRDDFGSSQGGAHPLGSISGHALVAGTIGSLDDRDFFSFTAAQSGMIQLTSHSTHQLAIDWDLIGGSGTWADGALSFDVVAGQEYIVSVGTSDGVGHYELDIELASLRVDWGTIELLEQESNLTTNENWFQFSALRDGILTIEADFAQVSGNIDLDVYDASFQALASSHGSGNRERVDLTAQAGQSFLLRVQGINDDVTFRLSNLVSTSNGVTDVFGTSASDQFSINVGSHHTLWVNDVEYQLDGASTASVNFHGESGDDSVVVTGTGANETATLENGSFEFRSTVLIRGSNVSDIRIVGNGGYDTAVFYDSVTDDTFTATPHYALLVTDGSQLRVEGFDRVDAHATAGGHDQAYFYDSAGNDEFHGRPTSSWLVGNGFSNHAQGFDRVNAYATGGNDLALLHDSSGDDEFHGRQHYSWFVGQNFHNYAQGFDRVNAYALSGGHDEAYLFDSISDDEFHGRQHYSWLRGEGFHNYAQGFNAVSAYATSGGHDRAFLFDSAGDDAFHGRASSSWLTGAGFFNYANGFDRVDAHANNGGGYDLAYLFDSTGDDAFYGRPNNSWLTGNGFLNFAQAFDRVNAYSTAGGNDAAYLFDSAGDDTFYDHSNSSWLLGDEFFNYGQGFSRVEAHLSDSGSDMAVFYDLADDDELSADGRWLAVRHGSRVVEGHDLDHVLAYARTGEHLTTDVSNVDFVFERIGDWSS